jgi:hypothetical protein
MKAPITLTLYDINSEVIRVVSRGFIPWKMLKKAITLNKQIGSKNVNDFEEEDIDALTTYIMEMFPEQDLSIEVLDEQSDVSDMFLVVKTVMSNARGIMDPTLPSTKK